MKVQVKQLVRRFGSTLAVDHLDFGFHEGQIFGFVGPNGAGKTTTMRIMATLDEPTSGDVLIDGVSVVEQPEVARKRVGFVPDSLPDHRDITIAEYLDFYARAGGLKGDERREVLAQVEAFTGVDLLREKHLNALSKGMKQRVSLARALIHDPELLIMDEPAAGLDPKARIELRELILALAGEGKAIFISSHILDELGELCHGVVIIEQGQLVHSGNLDAVLEAHEHATRRVWIRALGDPKALQRTLLELPQVSEAEILQGEVRISVEGDEEITAQILKALVQRDVQVVEFRQHREDLEDVFMQVTQGKVQ